MLDYIYHITLKIVDNRNFGMLLSIWCHLLRNVIIDAIT